MFIERNMSGDKDASGGHVETPIAFVAGWITEKNTFGGAWG
jgi:hypothetical protein